jgi:hypothetical protein
VHICEENVGVWGRFNYARQAKCEYVCVFDDDTIPGSRWLENCWTQFQKQAGIYGTIGIVLTQKGLYPAGGHFRVGWASPYGKCVEVDFVGHSWFFKREWLEYMFDGTEAYQQFKYVGEDMGLSFTCQKHGIKTFVPPHPLDDMELWGSMPNYSMFLGRDYGSVSQNSANMAKMQDAVRLYISNGWKPLYITNVQYVKKFESTILCNLVKYRFLHIVKLFCSHLLHKPELFRNNSNNSRDLRDNQSEPNKVTD